MKLNLSKLTILSIFAGMLVISSCENEVDIFAPQSDVTLVYGLLNVDDTLHQIKINRVFQGEKGLAELAQDPTVSEYDNINAQVIELEKQGLDTVETGRSWTLTEVTVTNKDSGYFYYPDQKIYQFNAVLLKTKFYKIVIDKMNETPMVESTTEVLGKYGDILIKPLGLNFIGLGLSDKDGPIDKITLEMNLPTNGKIIEVYLDFTYRDEYMDGSMSEYKTISYKVGTYVAPNLSRNPDKPSKVFGSLVPVSFYEFIAGKVPVVEQGSNIKQRIPNQPILDNMPLKFRYVVGGDQFNTYLEVASPSTSILETKPEYTNVKNGVGLFSCRTFEFTDSKLSNNSWEYLVNGEILEGRRFCDAVNSSSSNPCY